MAGKTKVPFIIYPEGGTTNGKYLMKFKIGAFQSLLPV
jgi:1-acyl-sn-glycerol-3-phosphate acyltransferase